MKNKHRDKIVVVGAGNVGEAIAYTLMVIAALACVFADFSGIVAGYFVVGGILLLSFVRAAVFALIDRKGL